MLESILSILFVYLFILLGLIAKKIFKEQMDSKTLTIFSVYFLQPFVAMWGFSTAKLSIEHGYVVLYYFWTSISYTSYIPTSIYTHKRTDLDDPKQEGNILSLSGFRWGIQEILVLPSSGFALFRRRVPVHPIQL